MLKKRLRENGAIMLEGIIVMVITMFVLIWLLAIGFIYYQRYTTTIVANDAVVKIASTYNNPTSDIIMGYVTTEDVSGRDLYRNFTNGALQRANERRATEYVKYMLDKVNFSGVIQDVDVELSLVRDSAVRKHIELTVTCTYKTPFGEALEMFGMYDTNTYSILACSDCTDILDYYSTVNFEKVLTDGTYTAGTGIVDSILKLLNSLVKTYNQFQS
jgi:hypothetical protein|nr:hypothetical protein [uncultured Acetatifactor sp.]